MGQNGSVSAQFESIIAEIREAGDGWSDLSALDRLASLPRVKVKATGCDTLVERKVAPTLSSLSQAFERLAPQADARSLASAVALLSVVSGIEFQLRQSYMHEGAEVRQSTLFRLTALYAELLAAQLLCIEQLRELVLSEGQGANAQAPRCAAIEEAAVDTAQRYAAILVSLPLSESKVDAPSMRRWAESELSAVISGVREFATSVSSGVPSSAAFLERTDRICEALGIVSSQ